MATTAKQTSSNSSASASVRSSSATVSQTHFQQNTSQLNITTTHHHSHLRSSSLSDSTTNHIYQHHQIYHSSSNNSENEQAEQDIEIIAKQISDHAEAIYQTWKARGLAPEILNCHSMNSDAFDKTLTPSVQRQTIRRSESPQYEPKITLGELSKSSNCIDTVSALPNTSAKMSNSNLKKLVSTFVNEDKARQQQQQQQSSIVTRKTNILTSGTIKDALRKFENIDNNATTNMRPNYLKNNRSTNNSNTVDRQSTATATTLIAQREKSPKLQLDQTQRDQLQQSSNSFETNKLNKNVPDVLINTIEQDKLIKPSSLLNSSNNNNNNISKNSSVSGSSASTTTISNSSTVARKKPETPAKPANLLNHQPAWSLKNRLKPIENGSSNDTTNAKVEEANESITEAATTATAETTTTPPSSATKTNYENDIKSAKLVNKQNSKSNKVNKLMDEVLMEEERLINALKTGTVLNNDKLPEVITSTLSNSNSKPLTNNTNSMTNAKIVTANAEPQQHPANWNGAQKTITVDTPKTVISNENNAQKSNDVDGVHLKMSKLRPKNDAAVPHPDLSLHTNKTGTKPANTAPAVRPFLTRGSVAERVLMFEKCPEIKLLRNTPKDANKVPPKAVPKPEQQTTCTTLQRTIRNTKNVYIPRFHFPFGKPLSSITLEQTLQRLSAAFDAYPNNCMSKDDFVSVLKICSLPFYWRMPLFNCTQLTPAGLVDGKRFCDFWKQMSVFCNDSVSRFVYIMSRGQRSRPYILPEDLVCLVQDVVDTHPGLAFLKEAAEFHSRYVHTVIARIFYTVNRSWSGRITMAELRRSDLLQVLQLLEEEEDINQIMAYFSYEHFYVIYCKFWELDRDHDLFIDQNDLARHNDHALSTRIIERIFSGCVTKTAKANNQRMSYTEFVWFLLSEEDKSHSTAIEYWFRCMDLDGDGVLSMYELEYFYEEQQHRMESIGIETLPFEDCLCQMLDMIKPSVPGCIKLGDLKRCKMTPVFFDTFFNLEKYMENEQRDPFASQREDDMSDWDRYAAQEYELLVAEEGGDTHGSYDDEEDYESNIDILESHMDDQVAGDINEL
ncbi:uncharacterized protein LOC116339452 [Contarinia nasturtii]|uniref:uncharacterized protein LOC116339452 n=1 Tax=Contarinia nasturtii TaxID=265458 RepID=UPI0012D4BE84|nr:uncharacterized protein LOC116339452 [Contarinia nasturtii]XP_031621190.1 uncharacterized protein LOC116339452 [Contarinia nasturtii]XP_031621191.1 uncharacterized protein LOC116339452 [Contarinia nasturtii]XP_031621192.1 uncharacterized protein LOC116339452 [Contarinia nasturtii]